MEPKEKLHSLKHIAYHAGACSGIAQCTDAMMRILDGIDANGADKAALEKIQMLAVLATEFKKFSSQHHASAGEFIVEGDKT